MAIIDYLQWECWIPQVELVRFQNRVEQCTPRKSIEGVRKQGNTEAKLSSAPLAVQKVKDSSNKTLKNYQRGLRKLQAYKKQKNLIN